MKSKTPEKNKEAVLTISILIFIATILILAYFFIFKNFNFEKRPENGGQDADSGKDFELLPDLAAYPARDVKIEKINDGIFLRFTTIFYNQGKGPFELRADPRTAGIRENIERVVFQRIYLSDGTYREKPTGTFLWHQPHLHYHFSDFVIYNFEAVGDSDNDLSDVSKKSTFCIRDVSSVDIGNKSENAKYLICGKEMQGLSVGWADTYFSDYPDQLIDITGLPSGKYRLSFIVNPDKSLDEMTLDNNVSSVLLDIDMDSLSVSSADEKPESVPAINHVYLEQVFEN